MTEGSFDIITDIAIIGAGPAGAGTSLFLSKKGIKHTCFDAELFPRDKVCGDALSGKTVKILKLLDSSIVHEMGQQKDKFLDSWGITFIAPDGTSVEIPFKLQDMQNGESPGFISRRIDFDHFLLGKIDHSMTNLQLGTKITDANYLPQGIELLYKQNNTIGRCLAQIVVGADGNQSVIARKLAHHRRDPKHFCSAIRAYYKNVKGMHEKNFIELYFLKQVLPGYLWIFPLPDNMANVGVGVLSARIKKKRLNLKHALQSAIIENPLLRDRFKDAELTGEITGWGLPLGSKKRSLSGERFLLTGDAASLIDPFSGEGIGNALLSSKIAADVLENAIKQQNFSAAALSQYDDLLYENLWDELQVSDKMQKLGRFQWLFNLVVNRAKKNQVVRDTISGMLEDINLRGMLHSPKFYFRLFFNY